MSKGASRRLLGIAWLVGWLLPPVASMGVLLHVAADPHRHGHDDGGHRALELALVATHGHAHELSASPHEHPGVRLDAAVAVPTPVVAFSTQAGEAGPRESRLDLLDAPTPTGSPPLFRSHCALLL